MEMDPFQRLDRPLFCEGCQRHERMRRSDFFWLGRVPCRTVQLVGLLVGVQVYEKRTVYYLDDGTGVIECALKHPIPPKSPTKAPQKKSIGSPKRRQELNAATSSSMYGLHPPPKPVASVGMSVRVTGRVTMQRQGRNIIADTIAPCISINEESQHWLKVCDLHRTHYFATNAGPFVIPQLKPKSTQAAQTQADPSSPVRYPNFSNTTRSFPLPQTPSKESVCSSVASSPSLASSPVGLKSPPRLRHPSRLHTRDLTVNTFRIYVKHYMDNVPAHKSMLDEESDNDEDANITFSLSHLPETPTRPRKRKAPPESTTTPRPNKRQSIDATPRAPSFRPSGKGKDTVPNPDDDLLGFTVSHLRRVPELALLARKVVNAEAKRREREERKKAKKQTQPAPLDKKGKSYTTTSSAPSLGKAKPGEGVGPKIKRLFRFAIRQLYDEGSIVLFDGGKHPLPIIYSDSSLSLSQTQLRLWKSSISTSYGHSTTLTSTVNGSYEDTEPVILSDPDPDEECYIPLTPSYLCREIEKAIKSITARAQKTRKGGAPGSAPLDILNYLRRKDDQWARLGEWHVKDALEWGQENGRLWCVAKGRWEVCH